MGAACTAGPRCWGRDHFSCSGKDPTHASFGQLSNVINMRQPGQPRMSGHPQIMWCVNPLDWLHEQLYWSGIEEPLSVAYENYHSVLECLSAWNTSHCVQHDRLSGHSVTGGWAKHVTGVLQVITCVLPVSLWHSHLKGQSLSCSVALVARTGVRYTAGVLSCERAISDYSGKFPQFTHLEVLTDLNDPRTVMLAVLHPSLLVGTSYNC